MYVQISCLFMVLTTNTFRSRDVENYVWEALTTPIVKVEDGDGRFLRNIGKLLTEWRLIPEHSNHPISSVTWGQKDVMKLKFR
jgi:hypothetical protein